MNTISQTNPFESIGLQTDKDVKPNKAIDNDLNQTDFLKLLTTQLQHQDPMKPLENTDFVAQMAQFGVNEGVSELNTNFSGLSESIVSNQALQASAMVGRSVLIEANTASIMQGQTISGETTLNRSYSNLSMTITNQKTGETVFTQNMGPQTAGTLKFEWDGKNESGMYLPDGNYKVAMVVQNQGESLNLKTNLAAQVESVTVGQGSAGLLLNLAGGGQVPFNNVSRIQ